MRKEVISVNTILTPGLGRWSFVLGALVAVLVGLSTNVPGSGVILFLLGLLVGLLNIPEKESSAFLVAVLTLLVVGVAGLQFGALTDIAANILSQFTSFVSAAALVVALKEVLTYAKG